MVSVATGTIDAKAARKLPPGENGSERCVIENDGEGVPPTDQANKRCYYNDEVAEGEFLTMCVQCDSHWRNCWEQPGSPKVKLNSTIGKPSGTISEPSGNPKLKITIPKRGGTLTN